MGKPADFLTCVYSCNPPSFIHCSIPSRDRRVSSSTLIFRAHSPTLVRLPTLPVLSLGGGGVFGGPSTASPAGGAAARAGVKLISGSGCGCSDLVLYGGWGWSLGECLSSQEAKRTALFQLHNRSMRKGDFTLVHTLKTGSVERLRKAAPSLWPLFK